MTDKDTRQDPTAPEGTETTGLPDAETADGGNTTVETTTEATPTEPTTANGPQDGGPTVPVPLVPDAREVDAREAGARETHAPEPEAFEPAGPESDGAESAAGGPGTHLGHAAAADGTPESSETASFATLPQDDRGSRRAHDVEPAQTQTLDRAAAIAAAKRPAPGATGPRPELDAEAQRRNAAREAALSAKPVLARVLQAVLAVAFPFLLVIGAIKAVASPWFLWLEYNRPGFPADEFGFTAAERLTYGSYGVDYLNNAAGPEFLGGLVDGSGNNLFLASEVAHMADVKGVVAATFLAGLILLVATALIVFYLGKKYSGGIRRGLFAGSVATVVVMAVVGVVATLNWQAFFAGFHQIFFADGTWTFSFSDTLIRLFPPQFWIDSGVAVAGLVLLVASATLIAAWPTARRRERSRLLQEARDFGLK